MTHSKAEACLAHAERVGGVDQDPPFEAGCSGNDVLRSLERDSQDRDPGLRDRGRDFKLVGIAWLDVPNAKHDPVPGPPQRCCKRLTDVASADNCNVQAISC